MSEKKITKKLHQAAKLARTRSYSPYSKFKVGAALITKQGQVFSGCNVENASYGGAVCAERTSILKAVSEGFTKFEEIVIVTESLKAPAYPCALCLQVMAEFFSPKTRIKIANLKGIVAEHHFIDLLPHPFGPEQLKAAR